VPLFVEELTKSVLASGLLREENDRYVLDRLGSARMVAQIGAAIERQFSYALIRAVSRLPEDELPADGTELLERVGAWLKQRARMKPAGKSFLVSEQHTCLARSLCSPHSAQMDIFAPVYSREPSNYSFKRSG
jgi:hypothetical protein